MDSKLLSEAIIDATALREAALKSAQQSVLERHAPEVKKALKTILEQEAMPDLEGADDDMSALDTSALPELGGAGGEMTSMPEEVEGTEPSDAAKGLPLAATEGEKLCACPDEEEEIEINFDELEKQMAAAQSSEEPMDVQGDMSAEAPISLKLEEEIEIDEALIKSLMEETELDEGCEEETMEETTLHVGSTCDKLHPDLTHNEWEEQEAKKNKKSKEEEAKDRENVVNENKNNNKSILKEAKELKAKVSSLFAENKELKSVSAQLIQENEKVKDVLTKLMKHLEETNLSNARLLYTNKALTSVSLNERQKQKIVEAISNAGSIEQVKLVFETLQNTVGSTSQEVKPKSLSQIVENKSTFSFARQKESTNNNPVYQRWAKVAGITKDSK